MSAVAALVLVIGLFFDQNGEQAVAFEIKENDNLKYFGTSFQFEIPNTISPDRVKLYAVQADGVRIEMTRK